MTLQEAQAAFRHSPGRVTALAYLDAAIEDWWNCAPASTTVEYILGGDNLAKHMKEIRDWLVNVRMPQDVEAASTHEE